MSIKSPQEFAKAKLPAGLLFMQLIDLMDPLT